VALERQECVTETNTTVGQARSIVALLFAALLCSTARADAPVRRDSLAGLWVWGSGPEPVPGPVQYEAACGSQPAQIRIVENETGVEATVEEAKPMTGGAVRPTPSVWTAAEERLRGTFDGSVLTLTGTHVVTKYTSAGTVHAEVQSRARVRLELRLVKRSGHLVGTRNGVAVWAARASMPIRPMVGSCPP
jgi:hypothetical protein